MSETEHSHDDESDHGTAERCSGADPGLRPEPRAVPYRTVTRKELRALWGKYGR